MANMITGIISITIGAIMTSTVLVRTIKDTNTSSGVCLNATGHPHQCSWSVAELSIWGLVALVGIVGLLYGVLAIFGLV